MFGHLFSQFRNWKSGRRRAADLEKLRIKYDLLLREIGTDTSERFNGTVAIDGTWDNPNYWLRFSLLRKALGLSYAREVGFLGEYRRAEQRGTFERLNISEIADLWTLKIDTKGNEVKARELCKNLKSPSQILEMNLPLGVPADFLYDAILKRQRLSSVNCSDPHLVKYVRDFLDWISRAEIFLDQYQPNLVISSHAIGNYFPIAWCALIRKIPVVVPFGDNGVLRLWKVTEPSQVHSFMDRPFPKEFAEIPEEQKVALTNVGNSYLKRRLSGGTNNLAVRFAYGTEKVPVSRHQICLDFGWDPSKPIVGIYASNWFDFPHALGMSNFRDFEDWILSTYEVACKNQTVNWLFRAHPADDWYGGLTLRDVMAHQQAAGHIRLSNTRWNGEQVLASIDAVVTFHGTIGVEAAAQGKPALVADRGWYDDLGFVVRPRSREDYLHLLNEKWWDQWDRTNNPRLAQIFAGCFWGRPIWQKNLLLEDDSDQWKLYEKLPSFLSKCESEIDLEVQMIRDWYHSSAPHLHTYKMLRAHAYLTDLSP